MDDAIWIRLQATCKCQACSQTTAVNAAVERLACDGCGADYSLREELWDSALEEAYAYAKELDANATTRREFDAGGISLSLAIAAVDALCPHCESEWHALPRGTCPECETEVSVRPVSAGTLVGEDRHMLAGSRGEVEPQTLSCSGCGAPLVADGSARKIVCQACTRETVVPDEIWRRVHAPQTVASWWLYAGGTRSQGLSARVRAHDMVGGAGVVYVLGGYGDTYAALFAIETNPLGLRWMVDLEALGKSMLLRLAGHGSRLYAYSMGSRSIEVFDASSGEHLQSITAPEQLTDLAPDPEGTLVCRTMTGELVRIDAQAQVQELWVKRGFFGRMFGAGIVEQAPEKGMRGFTSGRMGIGLDGELRVTSRRWVGHLARDGELRWSAEVAKANIAIVPPATTPEGTTFAVFRTVGGTMTVEELTAFTEAMVDGVEQSSSVLVRIPAGGGQVIPVRPSGVDEYTALAVTADGEQWLATGDGELLRLAPTGELLWRQALDDE